MNNEKGYDRKKYLWKLPIISGILLAFIIVSSLSTKYVNVKGANATYDADAAVSWALNVSEHQASNNAGDVCSPYVRKCLVKGGIPIPYDSGRYPNRILTWVRDNGYGTYGDVTEANLNQMSKGDVLVWCCDNHKELYGLHTVFIVSVDHSARTLHYCSNHSYHHDASLAFSAIKNFGVSCDACGTKKYVHAYILHLYRKTPTPTPTPEIVHPWSICETPGGVYGTNLVNSYYPQVKWIQAALNIIQNAGLTLDGYYGNGTKNAVVVFQQNHGLTADGIVGPNTTSKLVEELNARRYYDPKEDKKPPVISNVNVTDVSATGYTVSCTATDENGIDRVEFPTWTVLNGQDDISQNGWPRGTKNGDTYTYRVNVSEHNNESGQYITHIYAWDNRGNNVCYAVPVVNVPLPEAKVTGVVISSVSGKNIIVRGASLQLSAKVAGEYLSDTSVKWTVDGNTSRNTVISNDGLLKTGSDEKSASLTVKAIANADAGKAASITVKVQLFKDVNENQFFYNAVKWGSDSSTVAGYSEGDGTSTFRPNDICTRAQFVTFLWRTLGSQKPKSRNNPFVDIPDIKAVYYGDAVLWAYENHYVAGYSDPKGVRFAADDEVTRGQAVTFLWRAAGSPKAKSANSPFTDAVNPSNYFYGEAMLWANENGVVSGYSDPSGVRFAANDNCTRGQVVTFLWRYWQKYLQ